MLGLPGDTRGSRWRRFQSAPQSLVLGVGTISPTLLALLLIVTGILKFHLLITQPSVGSGLLSSRWTLISVVQLEWAFAAWLLLGLWRSTAWYAVTALFCCFAIVSIVQAVRGEACHCFGAISISPGFSLFVNAAAICLLVFSRQGWKRSPRQFKFQTATAILFLAMGLTASAFAVGTYQPTILSSDGLIVGAGRNVLLEPNAWVGKRFPLLPFVEKGDLLAQGKWDVWLYRHDCPECKRALRSLDGRRSETPVALIELPPYGTRENAFKDLNAEHMQIDGSYKWFGETPVELRLAGGVVFETTSKSTAGD